MTETSLTSRTRFRALSAEAIPSERFWSYVHRCGPDDCWLWTGATVKSGVLRYGMFRVGDQKFGAHRVAFALTHGEAPRGLMVCHSCDTPLCCNPAHLWPGTNQENMQDAGRKGRLSHWDRKAA